MQGFYFVYLPGVAEPLNMRDESMSVTLFGSSPKTRVSPRLRVLDKRCDRHIFQLADQNRPPMQ